MLRFYLFFCFRVPRIGRVVVFDFSIPPCCLLDFSSPLLIFPPCAKFSPGALLLVSFNYDYTRSTFGLRDVFRCAFLRFQPLCCYLHSVLGTWRRGFCPSAGFSFLFQAVPCALLYLNPPPPPTLFALDFLRRTCPGIWGNLDSPIPLPRGSRSFSCWSCSPVFPRLPFFRYSLLVPVFFYLFEVRPVPFFPPCPLVLVRSFSLFPPSLLDSHGISRLGMFRVSACRLTPSAFSPPPCGWALRNSFSSPREVRTQSVFLVGPQSAFLFVSLAPLLFHFLVPFHYFPVRWGLAYLPPRSFTSDDAAIPHRPYRTASLVLFPTYFATDISHPHVACSLLLFPVFALSSDADFRFPSIPFFPRHLPDLVGVLVCVGAPPPVVPVTLISRSRPVWCGG